MSPAHVLEPTYRRLKSALMEGAWPDGAKLEAMRLAEDLGVSMSPVRDSLNQLVGEGLVDLTPGEGFRVPFLTEQTLRDILDVNAALLEAAAHNDGGALGPVVGTDKSDDYVGRVSAAFSAFASSGGNRFLLESIERINDRLHRVRTLEPEVLPSAHETLQEIEASLQGLREDRLNALKNYHRTCRRHLPQLIKSLPGRR